MPYNIWTIIVKTVMLLKKCINRDCTKYVAGDVAKYCDPCLMANKH